MAPAEPHKAGRPRPAPTAGALFDADIPLPLYHHPAIALSLVLVVACVAQLAAWHVSSRAPSAGVSQVTTPALHGHLFIVIRDALERRLSEERAESVLFTITLSTAMLSAVAWYAVARLGIGPAWGLWTALLWVVQPAFVFLAQRNDPLTLLVLLTPLVLAGLLWWRKSKRSIAALPAGAALGLLTLVGLQGLLALPLALLAMLAAPMRGSAKARGVVLACLGFGLVLTAATLARPPLRLYEVMNPLRENAPLLYRQSPQDSLAWLGCRLWQSTYQTISGRFQWPVFVIEMAFLAPALWGLCTALRFSPWRWTAVACGSLVAAFWLTAALADPLARNLAPIGGVCVLFALVGAADIYGRIRGEPLPTRG